MLGWKIRRKEDLHQMRQYVFKRLLQTIPTLLAISLIVFSILYLTPGDPVLLMLGASETGSIDPASYEAVRRDLGLDKPFLQRYFLFLGNALKGDLGRSYITNQKVFPTVMERMPATLQLTFASMLVAVAIALPLGVLAAVHQGSIWDSISTVLATIGISMPNFWLGIMLIITFALNLKILPSFGIGVIEKGFGNVLAHLVLPAVTLGTGMAASVMRMTRSSMVEALGQDYVTVARAKGLPERIVIYRHALRNALIPVITVIGSQFGSLLGGAVVTETIFAWPGVGRLTINAISRRDYPMIQGATLILCFQFILVNLLVDILYAAVDPRIRLGEK